MGKEAEGQTDAFRIQQGSAASDKTQDRKGRYSIKVLEGKHC